jgi:diguanylate cyclase (GGDEF)-like protein
LRTITFYSYKGGVGRTLVVANVARYLALFGQKVFAVDFDLEAPGLHYKLGLGSRTEEIQSGLVDYLHSFVAQGEVAEHIGMHVVKVDTPPGAGSIHLLPAGLAPSSDYWRKLARVNWHELFYSENPLGVPFFLELKEKITAEFQPDFLLIDSRTGITEVGGVATSLLADQVVCLMVRNQENLEGAREVLRSVRRARRLPGQAPVEVLPVLTRLPEQDRPQEERIVREVLEFLNQEAADLSATLDIADVLVLHSDPDLQLNESLQIEESVLLGDYLQLFTKLLPESVVKSHIEPLTRQVMKNEEERRQIASAWARAEHLAYHDPLTDLPNRNLLVQHVAAALHRAERRFEGRSALLFFDLDRFKVINDSLGHSYGDEILRSIAERLRRNLLEAETVARMDGDGFVVLLPMVNSEWKIAQMAEKLLGLIRRPFELRNTELYVTASVGSSRFPEDGADPDELIRKAEIAMYQAKLHGGDQYQVYLPAMDTDAKERLSLENDLRRALMHGDLVLFYQPIVDARTGSIEGVEALLRWQHPERGLMGPAEFVWLAEVTGMSNAVDLWMLRTACREVSEWHKDGADVRVAVNLSGHPFQRPDLLDRIQEVLAETGLPPFMLQIEITETLAMQDAELSQSVLRGLKELGIRIAIDDFGTGYSSLSYLTTLPIETLKVDRSFVSGLGTDRGSGEITAAVISLAHSLKLDVVAEGVENEAQLEILRSQGCNKVQGYLFSPPIPAAACRAKVLEGRIGTPQEKAG